MVGGQARYRVDGSGTCNCVHKFHPLTRAWQAVRPCFLLLVSVFSVATVLAAFAVFAVFTAVSVLAVAVVVFVN